MRTNVSLNCFNALDKLIDEKGYSLKDLSPIMQDKIALLILFYLIIKAIFSHEKSAYNDERAVASVEDAATFPINTTYVGFRTKDFFLRKKFCSSL